MNSENFINVFIWGIVAIVIYEVFQASSQAALVNSIGMGPGSPGLTNELQQIVNSVPSLTAAGTTTPGGYGLPALAPGFSYNSNSMNAALGSTSANPYSDPTWTF